MTLRIRTIHVITALLGTTLSILPAQAQDGRFDIGVQLNGLGGSGKPTNDILGFGAHARYRLKNHWWIRFGIDHSEEFDVEGPAEFFGLPADFSGGVIDATGTSTIVAGWIERVYERGERFEWFWGAGAGLNFVDIDAVSGPLVGGGNYRIVTDAGDELVVSVLGGLRWRFAGHWGIEVILRGDQHLADWDLVDEVSGATASIDDYFIRGVTLGLTRRF